MEQAHDYGFDWETGLGMLKKLGHIDADKRKCLYGNTSSIKAPEAAQVDFVLSSKIIRGCFWLR